MQIEPITRDGHSTTYCYRLICPDGDMVINASAADAVTIYRDGLPPKRLESLKSALNYALGAPD